MVAKELLPATHLILDSEGPSSESRRGHALGQYRCEENYRISKTVSALCLAKSRTYKLQPHPDFLVTNAMVEQPTDNFIRSDFCSTFPIENVRNIINPSPIDQSRLQCDFKRMSNPAIIHWIGNQILGTCFCFNPDRIGPII